MYFKRLELTGFKSFADRTVVEIEPCTTAIVGPNGCGKSNILDALRWALGEQSAKELRGGHMHDVVFNGSENRSPMGMAEVSAMFDNADGKLPVDFSEVEITRRVYRSGESEYLINKSPCRLRDIQELFMDTGIGTQAYSMVGQGKMEMIISSKPEDRRYLFEEAAGVIKYKNRKRVAMRKLDSAEQNLLRLHDIITEVQRQMRSLKRQVNAAIRYRELSTELRELEIRQAWLEYRDISIAIRQLRADYAVAQNTYEKMSAEISQLEARAEELGLKRLEIDRVLMARRDQVHDIDSEMEKLERQIALLRQQIEFNENQAANAQTEREQHLQRADQAAQAAREAQERANATHQAIEASNAELEAKQAAHDEAQQAVQEADARHEAMRQDALASLNDRNRIQTEAETLRANIEHVDAQLNAIYDRRSAEDERRSALAEQLQHAQTEEQRQQDALAALEKQREDAVARQNEAGARLRELDESWQNLREQKSSHEARLNSLRELRDNYEGFAAGVRAVMQAHDQGKGNLHGIVGPAGDLLSTQKRYERAIEAALGGAINNIVVEDADAAKTAVNYLKNNRAGRVTFLPLDIIRGGVRDESGALAGQKGVIGLAIDKVEYDPKIRNAVEYLLHSTVIVESLDDAVRIAREVKRFPRLVTLDGEVVTSAGAVTGGRTRHESRGLLGRSAEITELEEKVAKADAELARLGNERGEVADAIQNLGAQVKNLQEQETALHKTINELGVAIARHTTELDNLAQSGESLTAQEQELQEQRASLVAKREEALARMTTLEGAGQTLQGHISEAQEAAAQARQRLAAIGGELADLRVRIAEHTQQYEEALREAQRLQREEENARHEAERRVNLAGELRDKQGELEKEIADNVERSKALSESREEVRVKVNEAENERQKLLDENDALEKRLRSLRDVSKEAQARLHQLELDLRQREDRIAYFQQRIREEYELTLASLPESEVGVDEYGREEREERVNDLRGKLHRMGDVNLTAIEEYEALERRHEFLANQAADLEKAKETLMSVVARSDKLIREMFLATFQAVSDNFRNYFRQLFGGGQARVYLLNEEDPLESGIEIEARPPGKKPQSIALLSGGEKALTSIALLFSIFKAKPSPFCVLDEVDAPLDDANIGRFLSLLDEFSELSQFVIITHNKQTMAHAGALYGVTMQERGVSQLVSVRFDEAPSSESAA